MVLTKTGQVEGALKAMPIRTVGMPKALRACFIWAGSRPFLANPSGREASARSAQGPPSRAAGLVTLELSLRRLLRNFGLKVGAISCGRFGHRIRALTADNPMLFSATGPMLRARAFPGQALAGLERRVRQLAQDDPVCHRLMSMPGVGAVVAPTYRSAVDDPFRFTSSWRVGLTPARNQSGDRDISGGITKAGDVALRRALYRAATVMMHEDGFPDD